MTLLEINLYAEKNIYKTPILKTSIYFPRNLKQQLRGVGPSPSRIIPSFALSTAARGAKETIFQAISINLFKIKNLTLYQGTKKTEFA